MKKIYSKFTRNRDEKFQIETAIYEKDNKRYVTKRALKEIGKKHIDSMYGNYCIYKDNRKDILVPSFMNGDEIIFDFLIGKSLCTKLLKLVENRDINACKKMMNEYKNIIWNSGISKVEPFVPSPEFLNVFGNADELIGHDSLSYINIDLTLDNLIETSDGSIRVIDYEWIFSFNIPLEFVLYRGVYAFCVKYCNDYSQIININKIYEFFGMTSDRIEVYERMNAKFMRYVCGTDKNYEEILKQYKKEKRYYTGLFASRVLFAQLYVDYGQGFSESNSFIRDLEYREEQWIEFNIPQGDLTDTLRLDLCNVRAGICIDRIELSDYRGDKVEYELVKDNALKKTGTMYVFDEEDMQIIVKLDNKVNLTRVFIKYRVVFFDTDIAEMFREAQIENGKALMEKECEERILENEAELLALVESKEQHIRKLNVLVSEIEAEKLEANNKYNAILYSFYWKLTKPLRLITDVIKKLLKKNRVIYKLCRCLKCIKQHGFRYTIKHASRKIRRKGNVKFGVSEAYNVMKNQAKVMKISEDILFSILVPLYNTENKYLKEMIESVQAQKYSNWELCLADGSTEEFQSVKDICEEYAQKDNRIHYIKLSENKGISNNTNECAKMANGQYIVLFDHDDLMNNMALYENAKAIYATDADVLYSDEDHVTEDGRHVSPLFKPDWSRDLLYSQMYICHLFVFKKALFEDVGGFRAEFDGSQDYDLMLRFSEKTERILHIPKLLYSWRETQTSTAINADSKPYAHFAGLNALDEHLKRRYGEYAYAESSDYTFVFEARYDLMSEDTMVSIIMPMKDHCDISDNCVNSILEKTSHQNYEILILDNNSVEKETFEWFDMIQNKDHRIKVIKAEFEFNWSKLNNFGMEQAQGDVFIFLNNDIVVISEDWMQKLGENALREDVGVVGPLLLFEDNTIQHAGIVVGIGGWADHLFRGMKLVHNGTPYISPMISRNVSAVTGACMVISKKTIDKIGRFDENFIVCGSDVEICMRAYHYGLNNMYNSRVRLYHLESKSRDASKVPQIDFERSYKCYTQFRENGDPYYNINLGLSDVVPAERADKSDVINDINYMNNYRFMKKEESDNTMNIDAIKRTLKKNPLIVNAYSKTQEKIKYHNVPTSIAEIQEINARKVETYTNKRLNMLTPSLNIEHVFGGIATALKFYKQLGEKTGFDLRIIITDSVLNENAMVDMEGFEIVSNKEDSLLSKQIVVFSSRYGETIPVGPNDIFMATGWWTAYTIFPVIEWQKEQYGIANKLIYFIQDYEPGFYKWSSRYLLSDSTYKSKTETIAIFNSKLLYEFFKQNGYSFANEFYFEPVLNDKLREILISDKQKPERKNQILIYGRPGTERNAFELVITSLNEWVKIQENAKEWKIISAGENFADVELINGQKVTAVGKMSLGDYANMMLETKIGISLMVSPHPSYPPLEMSTFGMKVITNKYANKDLASFNENMISLDECSSLSVAKKLKELCDCRELKNCIQVDNEYVQNKNIWEKIIESILKEI